MPDVSDMDLLRDYQRQGSEEAFAELVRRHVNLVYSAALRHAGIAAHAEEITQAVFVILARKAAGLRPDTILDAWLYETTRWTALSFLRGERRRQWREQEAYMQSTFQEFTGDSVWHQLSPLLDEAMSRLGKKDREAVVLRFFREKSLREVAAALQVTEAAAQSRVYRALEKLRRYFARRGVSSTTAIIAGAISANSVQAAPVALAKAVTAVAITKGAAASGSTLTLIKGALKIMAWTKMKTAVVAGAILILATGTTTVVIKHYSHHSLGEPPLTPANMASFQKESTKLVHDIKMATMACMLFAMDHRSQLPASFAQLNAWQHQTSLSDADWEFIASGNKDSFANPSKTIYVMEKEPRQSPDGNFFKVYATVDGRVFSITSPVEDFTAVEKQRGFLVQPAK